MKISPTVLLILANVAVYLFLGFKGVDFMNPSTLDLIQWGGNLGPYTLTGEKERLFSSMFLHGGLVHLVMNMYLLFQIGLLSETVWGKARFLMIYLLTGLFASLASAFWYSWESTAATVSVGASGALLGTAGALLVHAIKEKEKAVVDWQVIAQVVLLNVGFGFINQGVDNACHVGGAVAGLTIGSLLLLPLRSTGVFIGSGLSFGLFLFMPVPEDLPQLAAEIRFSFEELETLEKLKQKRIDVAAARLKELRLIPESVSMEDASGKSLVIMGGAADLIHPKGSKFFYVPNMESNSITKIGLDDFALIGEIKGPTLSTVKDTGCTNNLCLGRGVSGMAVSKNGKWAMVSSMVGVSAFTKPHFLFSDSNLLLLNAFKNGLCDNFYP